MSEEAVCLGAELSCGQGMALHEQQSIQKQRGGLGDHMLRILLGQELHQAAQNIHTSVGAEEVSPGQVRWKTVGQGGEGQQAGHQLVQTWHRRERGSHLGGHQPHAVPELEDASPHWPDHVRVQGVLLGQPLGEALLGVLPHSLLLQQTLNK